MDLCKDATTPQNMVSELLMNTYYRTSRLLFYYINLHRTVVNMPKFNPPDSFDFSHPVTWLPLEQRFARFRIATKLDKEDQIVQVSYLIYAMGTEAEQVIESFTFINDGDNEKFDPVMAKKMKAEYKFHYDRRHGVRNLSNLQPGDDYDKIKLVG